MRPAHVRLHLTDGTDYVLKADYAGQDTGRQVWSAVNNDELSPIPEVDSILVEMAYSSDLAELWDRSAVPDMPDWWRWLVLGGLVLLVIALVTWLVVIT